MKRRETNPASNQFPKCSPPSGTHRDSQSWVEKRRGRRETELTCVDLTRLALHVAPIKPGARAWAAEGFTETKIQSVISSLSELHRLEYTEIQRVGYRREGGGRRQR